MAEEKKRTIGRDDYHRLWGLLTLARQHQIALAEIEKAGAEITRETQEYDGPGGLGGHLFDAMGGRDDYSADALLYRLNIEVEDHPNG